MCETTISKFKSVLFLISFKASSIAIESGPPDTPKTIVSPFSIKLFDLILLKILFSKSFKISHHLTLLCKKDTLN
jgi:hypothetical protein